jgi:CDP-glucose 4,6-dehydratase
LVTGHTGFKGSWLCLWLCQLGAKVHGFALPAVWGPSGEVPLFVSAQVSFELASHWEANLRDAELLARVWRNSEATILFHLAAQPLVRESYLSPYETFEVNTLGTTAVLEALRLADRPAAAVIATTDKCYENQEQVWGRRENDPLGGCDPYSASKAAAEIVASAYRSSFFQAKSLSGSPLVRMATVRAGNVIGGGDWAVDRLVPDLARALLDNQKVKIRNPKAVRPWQHVLEPLLGYLVLAERLWNEPENPTWGSAWNFGPDPLDLWPVSNVADTFCSAWGAGAEWLNVADPMASFESSYLSLCIDKAVQLLGWKPHWSTTEAVKRAADWYKNCRHSGFNAAESCILDIKNYISVLN